MYIITEEHCQNCRLLKTMLGENIMNVKIVKASTHMDVCKELGIKTIPALVKDDKTVVFDLDDIVTEIEKDIK